MKHVILFIFALTFLSCKSTKIQEVPVEINSVHKDSLVTIKYYQLDHKEIQNCTIKVDTGGKVIEKITDRVITITDIQHDTLQVFNADTIEMPVYITATKVEKEMPIWCIYLITALLAFITALMLFIKLRK